MLHRIAITIPQGLDVDWFSDMARINFPCLDALQEDFRIVVPDSATFALEFRFDGNVATWMLFLVSNGVNFSYSFIG